MSPNKGVPHSCFNLPAHSSRLSEAERVWISLSTHHCCLEVRCRVGALAAYAVRTCGTAGDRGAGSRVDQGP